ncbi:MAG: hypothetical protein GY769_20225 [bacterium]|nr:hypothetical protein [bacterium]
MKKMIYAPEGLLGIDALALPPEEVEVTEHGERVSVIRTPLTENCFINLARKRYGYPLLKEIEREVLTEYLKPIQ